MLSMTNGSRWLPDKCARHDASSRWARIIHASWSAKVPRYLQKPRSDWWGLFSTSRFNFWMDGNITAVSDTDRWRK